MVLVASSEGGVVAMVMVGAMLGGGRGRGGVAERWRDGGGLYRDDTGVHDLAVDLHHHLIALR